MDLSVVIVNWNTRDLLAQCLDSVFAEAPSRPFDVWVVDNASQDGSAEMVRARFPQVRLICNECNRGFARATNQALDACQGEYVLLLNPDAWLQHHSLETMLQFMDSRPEVGILGCRLLNPDRSLQASCSSFPTLLTEFSTLSGLASLFPRSRLWGKYRLRYLNYEQVQQVDCVLGACIMVRREVFRSVGVFDERFFMYSEEVDLCYRARRRGWRTCYLPQAEAVHIWGGSSRSVPQTTLIRLYRSRIQFFRKHYGRLQSIMLKLLVFTGGVIRVGIAYGLGAAARGRPALTDKSARLKRYAALVKALPQL